jgi:hypothetical protein
VRTLVVAHCYRESDEVIRIISARKATQNERKFIIKGGKDEKEEYDFPEAVGIPMRHDLRRRSPSEWTNRRSLTLELCHKTRAYRIRRD